MPEAQKKDVLEDLSNDALDTIDKLKKKAKEFIDKKSAEPGNRQMAKSARQIAEPLSKVAEKTDEHSPVGAPLRKAVSKGDAGEYVKGILDGADDAPSWEDLGKKDMRSRGMDDRYGAPGAALAGGAAQSILEGEAGGVALKGASKAGSALADSVSEFGHANRAVLHGAEAGAIRPLPGMTLEETRIQMRRAGADVKNMKAASDKPIRKLEGKPDEATGKKKIVEEPEVERKIKLSDKHEGAKNPKLGTDAQFPYIGDASTMERGTDIVNKSNSIEEALKKIQARNRDGIDAMGKESGKPKLESIAKDDTPNPLDVENIDGKTAKRLRDLYKADDPVAKLDAMDDYALKKAKKEGRYTDNLLEGKDPEPQGPDTAEIRKQKAKTPQIEESSRNKQLEKVQSGELKPKKGKIPGTDIEGDIHGDYLVLDYGNELDGARTLLDQVPRRIDTPEGPKLWRMKAEREEVLPGKAKNDYGTTKWKKDPLTGRPMGVFEESRVSKGTSKLDRYEESLADAERGHAEDGRASEDPDKWKNDMGIGDDGADQAVQKEAHIRSHGDLDVHGKTEREARELMQGRPTVGQMKLLEDNLDPEEFKSITSFEEASARIQKGIDSGEFKKNSWPKKSASDAQLNKLREWGVPDEELSGMSMLQASERMAEMIEGFKAKKAGTAKAVQGSQDMASFKGNVAKAVNQEAATPKAPVEKVQKAEAPQVKLTDTERAWLTEHGGSPDNIPDVNRAREILGQMRRHTELVKSGDMLGAVKEYDALDSAWQKAKGIDRDQLAVQLSNLKSKMNSKFGTKWHNVETQVQEAIKSKAEAAKKEMAKPLSEKKQQQEMTKKDKAVDTRSILEDDEDEIFGKGSKR